MADEVRAFQVTIPHGTASSSPQTTDLSMPSRIVRSIRVRIPPGPRGNVGFAISVAGTAILPWNAGEWIIGDDEVIDWPLARQITSGAWQLMGYNDGIFDHTLYVQFLLDLLGTTAAAGVSTPVSTAAVVAASTPTSATAAAAQLAALAALPAAPSALTISSTGTGTASTLSGALGASEAATGAPAQTETLPTGQVVTEAVYQAAQAAASQAVTYNLQQQGKLQVDVTKQLGPSATLQQVIAAGQKAGASVVSYNGQNYSVTSPPAGAVPAGGS